MEAVLEQLLAPIIGIEVSLTSWPDITLEVSEHFYVIFWFAIIFLVIILFNLALITTGMVIYATMTMIKTLRSKNNLPVPLQEETERPGQSSISRN